MGSPTGLKQLATQESTVGPAEGWQNNIGAEAYASSGPSKVNGSLGERVASPSSSGVPPSILGNNGNIPPGIGGIGTPVPMQPTANPSLAAEMFAKEAFNGQAPLKVLNDITGKGSWVAIMPDGTAITYRPAGQASQLTDPGTATVEVNSAAVKRINNGKVAKFKFPQR